MRIDDAGGCSQAQYLSPAKNPQQKKRRLGDLLSLSWHNSSSERSVGGGEQMRTPPVSPRRREALPTSQSVSPTSVASPMKEFGQLNETSDQFYLHQENFLADAIHHKKLQEAKTNRLNLSSKLLSVLSPGLHEDSDDDGEQASNEDLLFEEEYDQSNGFGPSLDGTRELMLCL